MKSFHLVLLCGILAYGSAPAQSEKSQVAVGLSNDVNLTDFQSLKQSMGGQTLTEIKDRTLVVELPSSKADEFVQQASQKKGIRYVEKIIGASEKMFAPVSNAADMTPQQQERLNALKSQFKDANPSIVKFASPAFKLDLLKEAKENSIIQFSLPDGSGFAAPKKMVTTDPANPQKVSWEGGSGLQGVTMVVNGDRVTGTIQQDKKVFSIRPIGGGLHAILEMKPHPKEKEHPPSFEKTESLKKDQPAAAPSPEGADVAAPVVDLLVAWTPAVESEVGGKAAVEDLIDLAVKETNLSYANSGVTGKVRLVAKIAVNYVESGSFDTDLEKFRTKGDGVMDEIHQLRDDKKADVCVLLIKDDAYCGLAADILANADTAFCVVYHQCATGYYSFGHEIGHLMGARHNREADATDTPFPYGHGYWLPGKWRTVMSYDSNCGCPRKPYWANPNIKIDSDPTGIEATNFDAKVLNQTMPTVAKFR